MFETHIIKTDLFKGFGGSRAERRERGFTN
jgi:hypothetical protein